MSKKNQTSPIVLDATGYMPYLLQRYEREKKASVDCSTKASKNTLSSVKFWSDERRLSELEDYVEHGGKDLYRNQWECATDKKCLYTRVRQEMDKVMEQKQIQLRERQQRLKHLLSIENEEYAAELKCDDVPAVMPKEEMLNRYKEIMVQKELERRKVADEKREQQFRNNCDELRTLISKKLCCIVTEEGKSLMEERNKRDIENSEDDKMYTETWLKDADAKHRKECEEESLKKERDRLYAENLHQQFQDANQKPYDPAHDESQLMDEQQRLYELEKEWEKSEKRLKQARLKKDLDKCLKSKLQRKAKEVQEDLMLDLYYLDKAFSKQQELQKSAEKKKELKKQQDEYLEYLAKQIQKEAEFQKRLEKLEQEESDKMWAIREKEWEADRKMRETHNKIAMRQLYEQNRNKLEKCRIAEELKIQYDEEIKKQVELDKKHEQEEKQLAKEKKYRNQALLLEQIKSKKAYVQQLKEKEKDQREKLRKLQEEYDRKIEQIMSNAEIQNIHPCRSSRSYY